MKTEENNIIDDDDLPVDQAGALEGMPPSDVMVIYPNPEKQGCLKLGMEEYMPDITSRVLLSGPPGSGKRNVILNLIRRIIPPPSVCHIVHQDPSTTEYDILGEWGIPCISYGPTDFPTLKNLDDPWSDDEAKKEEDPQQRVSGGGGKLLDNQLVVVDEITADSMGKKGAHRFERLVNHGCTHRNTTLLCSIQSAVSLPASVRRGFNHFALWKQPDQMLNKMLAQRSGISSGMLDDLFTLLKDPHEFIWIDLASGKDSPWRYRLGMMDPILIEPVD